MPSNDGSGCWVLLSDGPHRHLNEIRDWLLGVMGSRGHIEQLVMDDNELRGVQMDDG